MKYLEQADDRVLKLIYGMIKADQNTAVGFRPNGSPIIKEELVARAERSEEDIKEGRVKSLQQLKDESKNW